VTENLDDRGERLRLKLKEEWVGKQITVMAWLHSPDETVSATTKVVAHCVAFFIGGADDKERLFIGPTNIIEDSVRIPFNNELKRALGETRYSYYSSYYLDYSEANGGMDVLKLRRLIPNRKAIIYIVGHSLGGWNGAHLSRTLDALAYDVKMLITLDPVGEFAKFAFDIPVAKPNPAAEFWINIRAQPTDFNWAGDLVSRLGNRWEPDSPPDISYECDTSHDYAGTMFFQKMTDNKSAADRMLESIITVLK
jgi:hypothetical protein